MPSSTSGSPYGPKLDDAIHVQEDVNETIGYVKKKWTLPTGQPFEMDAQAGTLRQLQPAVA